MKKQVLILVLVIFSSKIINSALSARQLAVRTFSQQVFKQVRPFIIVKNPEQKKRIQNYYDRQNQLFVPFHIAIAPVGLTKEEENLFRGKPKTKLFSASENNDLHEVKKLLQAGADPNEYNNYFNYKSNELCTALHIAILNNNIEIVRELLKKKNIDITMQTVSDNDIFIGGNTALHLAAILLNEEILIELLKFVETNFTSATEIVEFIDCKNIENEDAIDILNEEHAAFENYLAETECNPKLIAEDGTQIISKAVRLRKHITELRSKIASFIVALQMPDVS